MAAGHGDPGTPVRRTRADRHSGHLRSPGRPAPAGALRCRRSSRAAEIVAAPGISALARTLDEWLRHSGATLRILHVISGLGIGGAERQLVNLSRELVRRDHKVLIYTLNAVT